MHRFNISPSKLEAYRYFKTNEYATEEQMMESLLGVWKPSAEAQIGTHIHKAIEESIISEKFVPPAFMDQKTIIGFPFEYYQGVPEVWARHKMKLLNNEVFWNGKIDLMVDDYIVDFKTTWTAPKYSNYRETVPWMMYLMATGCTRAVYEIFKLGRNRKTGEVYVQYRQRYDFDRFAGMEQYVRNVLEDFISWVKLINDEEINKALTPYKWQR